jgi:hypothetical protein
MSDPSIDPTSADHSDKYNDPRAKITRRGIGIGVAIAVLGIVGAVASIHARRTRLEQTTRFWGAETITALQLAEQIELVARGKETFETVNLAGTPGLGHLRHLLLDEGSFDWKSETNASVAECCGEVAPDRPRCIQLRFTDPTANRIDVVEIDLDLEGGWVGPSDGSQRVRTIDRVRPKLQNYFKTIQSVKQKRYDHREH